MRILLVTPFIPHRGVAHGAATVTARYCDYFAARHELRVLAFYYDASELALLDDVRGSGASIEAVAFPGGRSRMLRARLQSLVTRRPLVSCRHDSPEMLRAIRRALALAPVDLIQMDLPWIGQYLSRVDRRGAKAVLLELDVATKPLRRAYESEPAGLRRCWRRRQWRAMERHEPALCSEFDAVYAVSEEDRQLLRSMNRTLSVGLFRYGVNDDLFRVEPKRACDDTLVFIGSFAHPPNVDAMVYFCDSVLPRVQEQRPGAQLLIVGASPPPSVMELARRPGVTVTGRVPAVAEYLARADVCVVPLRLGGGVKLKTLEMMAAARAVVTTPVGCEGIAAIDGRHLLVARSAGEFSSKVVSLLRDDSTRATLAAEARKLVREEHRWETSLGRLERDYQELTGTC